MKTLEQIKNDYAVSKGYIDWHSVIRIYALEYIEYEEYLFLENEVMKIYAMECLKLANKNLSLEECGFDDRDYGITNEKNIIKWNKTPNYTD